MMYQRGIFCAFPFGADPTYRSIVESAPSEADTIQTYLFSAIQKAQIPDRIDTWTIQGAY